MPRQARLDAFRSSSGIFDSALRPESSTGTLRHGMVRGIERTTIFRDDTDRTDFVARLAALAESGALTGYAWAFLPNHAHWLVRTGIRPCSAVCGPSSPRLRGAFNRPHKRVGHRFQNRYKSIVVEEEPYLCLPVTDLMVRSFMGPLPRHPPI